MEGEHAGTEAGDRTDGSSDGVGDVVELEIEKDGVAAGDKRFEDSRPGGCEELEADFEPATGTFEAVDESESIGSGGRIECNDEPVAGCV